MERKKAASTLITNRNMLDTVQGFQIVTAIKKSKSTSCSPKLSKLSIEAPVDPILQGLGTTVKGIINVEENR